MADSKFLTFNNGEKMPIIGIGTWQVIIINLCHLRYLNTKCNY